MSNHNTASNEFVKFIEAEGFPCVGAKSALAGSGIRVIVARDLRDDRGDAHLLSALQAMPTEPNPAVGLIAAVALFPETPALSEGAFETHLWERLGALHNVDRANFDWDHRVSCDPNSANFGMSIGGSAFFVVGLHPGASRLARRAPMAMMAFNPHSQFRRLKAEGKYKRMQQVVRDRDIAIQGDINPMLAEHGVASEANQYSGREAPLDWACPFRIRSKGSPSDT